MAAIFGTIFNAIKTIGKPILNTVNSLVQSLDADGSDRQRMFRQGWGRNSPLISGLGGGFTPLGGMRALDMNSDKGEVAIAEEDQEVLNTAYVIKKVREMNVMINEIPFLGYDEFSVPVTQSYSVTIPSGLSLIATNFCSPAMNLGKKFVALSKDYRLFRVDKLRYTVDFQNQNFSTQTVAYDPIITKQNKKTMQEDIQKYTLKNTEETPSGQDVVYFQAYLNGNVPAPGNRPTHTQSEYMALVGRIKTLPTSSEFNQLVNGAIEYEQPGFTLVGMTTTTPAPSVIYSGMQYSTFDFTENMLERSEEAFESMGVQQMPVYGKFHFCLSNTFKEPVDIITTVEYMLTCKRNVQRATYLEEDGLDNLPVEDPWRQLS